MKFLRCTIACGVGALLASTALSQSSNDADDTAQGDVAVTIYNNNLALIQDVREVDIRRGRSRVELPDVSASITPQTLSFYARDTTIIEQNFDFDLLTPGKLMDKAIGETVTLLRTNPATGRETRERATVLSTAGGVVVQIGDRIEVLRDDGLPVRVIFDEVPPNLRARPTLSVNLDSTSSGTRPVSIRYLSGGLGWSSDYVALFDEQNSTIDMQGWVTLRNNTGTTFHQADTVLVAGNPTRNGRGGGANLAAFNPGTEAAGRERLGDFYLYPISERTTIANAQTKQVSFLDVQAVPARKVYTRAVGWLTNDSRPVNATSAISFSTSRDQGLGDALPAGTVRFYQRDAQGTPQFIGENGIGHTPMGSELALTTGEAFDIFVQAEVENRERITAAEWRQSARYRVIEDGEIVREVTVERPAQYYRTTMRYRITNAKSEAVEVDLTQSGLMRRWWGDDYRIISEDIVGEQINFDRRKWIVPVPAEGETVLRVTYETRY